MSDKKIYVCSSWLKPLQLGMLLKTVSPIEQYFGQTLEIIGLEHDKKNPMDGYVTLKLEIERKVDRKLTSTARFWWVYEHCALVGHVKDEKR